MVNRLGAVYLRVVNLHQQLTFYQQIIGLQIHRQEEDTVFLGAGGADLLALIHRPAAVTSRGQNGLYHFALLLPSRSHLARALHHLLMTRTPLQGLSDHVVSEAIYLSDPEGNGIELYTDRPQSQWYRNGKLQMASLPVDVPDLMSAIDIQQSIPYHLPPETVMGHVHLHVHDLPEAIRFYRDRLGMQLMFQIPTAAFLAYDGYHHHLGVNTWAGELPHGDNYAGLHQLVMFLPEEHWESLSFESSTNRNTLLRDPESNRIQVELIL